MASFAGAHPLLPQRHGMMQHGTASRWGKCTYRATRNYVAIKCCARDGPALVTLPLCPLGQVLHPTNMGTIQVFEPHLLSLFRDMCVQPADERRFVHIMSGPSVPHALLDEVDNKFGGLPRVGCAAKVVDMLHSDEGGMTVSYVGDRRVQLIHVNTKDQEYKVGLVEWLDDKVVAPSDPLVAALEHDVYVALQEVHRLSEQLGQPDASLPQELLQHAPPPLPSTQGAPLEELLRASGKPAAHQLAMWRQAQGKRRGRGPSSSPSPSNGVDADPYVVLREGVGRSRRQELFSFAAASVLEPTLVTRTALLITTDTAARLQFVLEVIKPHLQQLRAQAAVQAALPSSGVE